MKPVESVCLSRIGALICAVNTEPVVRLNIEAKADRDLVRSKLEEITKLLQD